MRRIVAKDVDEDNWLVGHWGNIITRKFIICTEKLQWNMFNLHSVAAL